MRGDQCGDDRQAEARAAGGPGLVGPVEALEDVFRLVASQARAVIGYLEDRGRLTHELKAAGWQFGGLGAARWRSGGFVASSPAAVSILARNDRIVGSGRADAELVRRPVAGYIAGRWRALAVAVAAASRPVLRPGCPT